MHPINYELQHEKTPSALAIILGAAAMVGAIFGALIIVFSYAPK